MLQFKLPMLLIITLFSIANAQDRSKPTSGAKQGGHPVINIRQSSGGWGQVKAFELQFYASGNLIYETIGGNVTSRTIEIELDPSKYIEVDQKIRDLYDLKQQGQKCKMYLTDQHRVNLTLSTEETEIEVSHNMGCTGELKSKINLILELLPLSELEDHG